MKIGDLERSKSFHGARKKKRVNTWVRDSKDFLDNEADLDNSKFFSGVFRALRESVKAIPPQKFEFREKQRCPVGATLDMEVKKLVLF